MILGRESEDAVDWRLPSKPDYGRTKSGHPRIQTNVFGQPPTRDDKAGRLDSFSATRCPLRRATLGES